MSTAREEFLDRVRRAVAEGNRAGTAPPLPERGEVGYQGAGDDPVGRFCQECAAAGGHAHRVADGPAALALLRELLAPLAPRRILLGDGPFLDTLDLPKALADLGEGVPLNALDPASARETFFSGDVGVSGVDYLIAETGSVVVASRPGQPRSLSLLPPVHIALAHRDQIVPDLFDLLDRFPNLPSNLAVITGPSKTGDIELRLVTGVHGPGEVHVIVVGGPPLGSP